MGFLKDTKDGDKVALLLLYSGLVLLLLGTGAILVVIFHVDNESKLDRALLSLTALGAQGSGLVTAAMGVLRFQSKPTVNGKDTPPESPKP